MKTLKYIIPIAFTATIISSCGDDFLDSKPLTKKTDVTYYTTVDEAEEALIGCFDGLQRLGNDTKILLVPEICSDNCYAGLGNTDPDNYRWLSMYKDELFSVERDIMEDYWKAAYVTINRCNMLLSRLDQISWTNNEKRRKTIEAEARFIRAYTHFVLVQFFGNIPLMLTSTTDAVAQSSPDEVYKAIADDLIFAAENGTEIITESQFGHVSCWAAKGLLGRVFLYYTGYYQKDELPATNAAVTKNIALQHIEDVINSGNFSLVPEYYNLWPSASLYWSIKYNGGKVPEAGATEFESGYAGEVNTENIFAIRYTFTGDYNGSTDGWRTEMWALRDNPSKKYGYANGWGGLCVTADFVNSFTDATDVRKEASVIDLATEDASLVAYQQSNVKEYTGYFTKKYNAICDADGTHLCLNMGGGDFMIANYQDFVVLRYADILLMAAELGSTNALNYLNEVHARSGAANYWTDASRDNIYTERRWEFAFEGTRLFDLLRYDGCNNLSYAAERVDAAANAKVFIGGIEEDQLQYGSNLKAKKGLFPIPPNQIGLSNGKVKQNEGWANVN